MRYKMFGYVGMFIISVIACTVISIKDHDLEIWEELTFVSAVRFILTGVTP